MLKGSHHKENVTQHCMGARIWKASASTGRDGHQNGLTLYGSQDPEGDGEHWAQRVPR